MPQVTGNGQQFPSPFLAQPDVVKDGTVGIGDEGEISAKLIYSIALL